MPLTWETDIYAVTTGHLNVVDQTCGFKSNANADKGGERKNFI